MKKNLVIFLLILLSTKFSFAQNSNQEKTLKPIIVVANVPIAGDNFLSPTQIDVVEGDEKRIREKTSLGETLDYLAGVRTVNTGSQVGKPVIRGLSGERIRVISNGVAVDHQQYDSRHQPNIDPFLSERIEVIQGPASILYGSGALGGAVDVQSLTLDFSNKKEFEFGGDSLVGYSSNNEQFDRGIKVKTRNKNFSVSAGVMARNGERITTANAATFDPENPNNPAIGNLPYYTGKLPFTDFDQLNSQFGIGFKNGEDEYKLRFTQYKTKQNFLLAPGGHHHEEEEDEDDEEHHEDEGAEGAFQNLENNELQFASKIKLSNIWNFTPTFSWQNNLRQETHDGEEIDVEFDLYTARLITEHKEIGFFDGGKIGFEYSFKDQVSRGTEQLTPGAFVNNYAIFAFEEKQIDDLKLQIGLRHDWHEFTVKESKTTNPTNFSGDVKREFSEFSGSFGGAYKVNENFVIAGNVGRGFRAPSVFELFSDGSHVGTSAFQEGNQDLKAEKSLNTDLSLRYKDKGEKLTATIYRNKISNFTFLNNTGRVENELPVFEFLQTNAVIQGFTLDASKFITKRIEIRAVIDLIEGRNRNANQGLPQIPANEYKLETTYYAPDLKYLQSPYFRIGITHNSAKKSVAGEPFSEFDDEEFGQSSTDKYTLLDLAAGFELRLKYQNLKKAYIDFEVKNATNEDYRNFLDTYKGYALSPGRNIMVKLRVPFGFDS